MGRKRLPPAVKAERERERKRRYYQEHKYTKEYYEKNRERLLKNQREWRKKNPEKAKEIWRKWYDTNKRKVFGFYVYNGTEQHFFKTIVAVAKFLGITTYRAKKLLYTNIKINNWEGEEAL